MADTAGQAAYECWADLMTRVHVHYAPVFAWNQLPKSAKDGWEEIAAAAIDWSGKDTALWLAQRAKNDDTPSNS